MERTMIADIAQHRQELRDLCRRFHVRRLEVFGSAARGDFDPAKSDIDFLVEFAVEEGDLGRFVDFKEALEALLNRRIDLVDRKAIEASRTISASGTYWPARSRSMPPDCSGASWRDAALLLDILLAAEDALAFIAGLGEREFLASGLHQSAVIHKLTIMGEAAGQVSKSFCAAHPEIPWKQMNRHAPSARSRLWRRTA
jgi:uncharacterized protein